MWEPFCHDWDVIQERNKLEKELILDESSTVSIDIPTELFLKLAEMADLGGSLSYGYYGCLYNDLDEVKCYIEELLRDYAFENEKTEEACKVLSKTK